MRFLKEAIAGATRELHLLVPNVAGRVDDYFAPLQVGSIYTLKVPLSRLWCPAIDEIPVKLMLGEVHASARYYGGGSTHESGRFVLNYWGGSLRSNALKIKR